MAVTSRKRNVTATSLYQSLVSRPISGILSPSSLISPCLPHSFAIFAVRVAIRYGCWP